jgi:sulfur relay (sulfurtransferase) complex TusBCD TusD component (DsrE family)
LKNIRTNTALRFCLAAMTSGFAGLELFLVDDATIAGR